MKKKIAAALGLLSISAANASAAGIADVATELSGHAASIAALSAVGLAITGAYLVIHHTKKGARAAGS